MSVKKKDLSVNSFCYSDNNEISDIKKDLLIKLNNPDCQSNPSLSPKYIDSKVFDFTNLTLEIQGIVISLKL